MDVNVKDLNREELNGFAQENYAEVIPDPTAYRTKDELLAAVEAAIAGEPIPAPASTSSGSTVTFTGTDDELDNTRSVRVGDTRFLIDTPVAGVDDETVDICKGLEGHNFDVE